MYVIGFLWDPSRGKLWFCQSRRNSDAEGDDSGCAKSSRTELQGLQGLQGLQRLPGCPVASLHGLKP